MIDINMKKNESLLHTYALSSWIEGAIDLRGARGDFLHVILQALHFCLHIANVGLHLYIKSV